MNRLLDLGGWVHSPATVARIVGAAAKRRFWDEYPALKGTGAGKTIMLHGAFDKVHGAQPVYLNQTEGTCVGRGGGRAGDLLQTIGVAAKLGKWLGWICSAGIYGGARVEIGSDIHGNRIGGDGAVVAYGVECATKIGCVLCEKTPKIDLTDSRDDDDLAVKWGRTGIPDDLELPAREHLLLDWAPVENAQEASDAIANGNVIWLGTSRAFWRRQLPAKRDAKGFLYLSGTTAHSWICTGTVDLGGGNFAIVQDNKSWGDDWVEGPDGGWPIGAGRFLSTPEDFDKQIAAGEAYAVGRFAGLTPPDPRVLDYLLL